MPNCYGIYLCREKYIRGCKCIFYVIRNCMCTYILTLLTYNIFKWYNYYSLLFTKYYLILMVTCIYYFHHQHLLRTCLENLLQIQQCEFQGKSISIYPKPDGFSITESTKCLLYAVWKNLWNLTFKCSSINIWEVYWWSKTIWPIILFREFFSYVRQSRVMCRRHELTKQN